MTRSFYRPFRRCAWCSKRASGRYCERCDMLREAMVNMQLVLGLPYIVLQKLWEDY